MSRFAPFDSKCILATLSTFSILNHKLNSGYRPFRETYFLGKGIPDFVIESLFLTIFTEWLLNKKNLISPYPHQPVTSFHRSASRHSRAFRATPICSTFTRWLFRSTSSSARLRPTKTTWWFSSAFSCLQTWSSGWWSTGTRCVCTATMNGNQLGYVVLTFHWIQLFVLDILPSLRVTCPSCEGRYSSKVGTWVPSRKVAFYRGRMRGTKSTTSPSCCWMETFVRRRS